MSQNFALSGAAALSPSDLADMQPAIAAPGQDPETATPAYRTKVERAAEKFESFFIEQILQQMRRTLREIDPDEAQNSKRGEDDMVDLADSRLADTLSQRHAFGVADAILRQLLPPATPTALRAQAAAIQPAPQSRAPPGSQSQPAAFKGAPLPVASSR